MQKAWDQITVAGKALDRGLVYQASISDFIVNGCKDLLRKANDLS